MDIFLTTLQTYRLIATNLTVADTSTNIMQDNTDCTIHAVAVRTDSRDRAAGTIIAATDATAVIAVTVTTENETGYPLRIPLIFFEIANNICMGKLIDVVKHFSDKRFSTIAGTLVYFLLMSIAPFILWLTIVFGSIDFERFLSNELFESVSPVLRYLKDSAENAASGAGIVFLVTTLYSSANFFYHLRRSGEIVYASERNKHGIKLRLVSMFLIILAVVLIAVTAGIAVTGKWILDEFLPFYISDTVSYIFLTATAFATILVLNIFACPYKLKAEDMVPGSLLTIGLCIIFLIGFTVYVQFADPERLYGKIASLIIFLLWCYAMMCCFVIGLIYNSTFKVERTYKTLL